MGMGRVEFIFLCLVGLVMVHVSYAQDSQQDYLNAHNAARGQVGVGGMTWDNNVAGFAQNYVNGLARGSCNMVHSGGPYLASSSGDMSGTDAVNMWVDERQFYNEGTNSCNGGECLHYTQVVWRNSVRLGCAKARCNNGGTIISCNYDPPGNWIGERPY
ncbi:Pathogenesis-related protein [Thalictrum thalictroides]|uniref:Pathogenesis-related protein n=1 Tax=Thalictrum thalictroides TaxID=46969 RepID=A0A7J6WT85_THATH|nr:Pathogenesis-related protein [Thalictrum thalictroides]